MKKLRFVKAGEDPNLGFSDDEIKSLCEATNFAFPETYLQFLKVAGRKSNIFSKGNETPADLIESQNSFKNLLVKYDESELSASGIWYFGTNTSGADNHHYFFKLNAGSNPKVFSFSDGTYLIDNGHNSKLIGIAGRNNFAEFINDETERKFGYTIWESIFRYSMLVLLFPIWLPVLISLKLKTRKW